MNLLKIIVTNYFLLGFFVVYTQEKPAETTQPTQATATQTKATSQSEEKKEETPVTSTSEAKPAETKPETTTAEETKSNEVAKATETKPTETSPEEKKEDERTAWKNHLQTLLVKDAHWATTNTPSTEWQGKAIDLATAIVKKDISLVDEVKSEYLTTVKDKYTNIEKSANIDGFSDTIEHFNKEIDKIAKELTPKEEKAAIEAQASDGEKKPTEENVEGEKTSTPEEKNEHPAEEKKEENAEAEAEKEKSKKQATWKECLQKIKKEGIDEAEVKNILQETTAAAKVLLLDITDAVTQKDQMDIIENEFEQAVKERSGDITLDVKLLPITDNQINAFKNEIEAIVLKGQAAPQYQPIMPPIQPPLPEEPPIDQQKVQQAQLPQKITSPVKQTTETKEVTPQKGAAPTIVVVTQHVTKPSSATVTDEQEKAEALAKIKEKQDLLAKNIKIAAAQKAKVEKEESQKGIISSLMEAVLGSLWTGKPAEEAQTLEKLRKEEEALITEMIQNKFQGSDRENITFAYKTFQDKLSSFNANKLWDKDQDQPKSTLNKWISDIQSSLKVLLKFDILNSESVTNLLKETIEKSKISAKGYKYIIDGTLIPYLQKCITELEEERKKAAEQKEKEKKEAEEREQQRTQLAEQTKQQAIEQEEKEKQQAVQQKEKEKTDAIELFNKSENEWTELMKQIAASKPASTETNTEFTKKALQLTENMFTSLPFVPERNKQKITEQHIESFSKAFLKQGTSNPEINIHDPIEKFNTHIHELAKK